jgi:hypothetical protein
MLTIPEPKARRNRQSCRRCLVRFDEPEKIGTVPPGHLTDNLPEIVLQKASQ